MAIAAVLNTVELLENILLHLDMQTLLLSQATSKAFRQTTQHSLALQRKLFLAPALSSKEPVINPLLEDRRFNHDRSESVKISSFTAKSPLWEHYIVRLHFLGMHDHPEPASASWRRMLLCQPQLDGELWAYVGIGAAWEVYSLPEGSIHITSETRIGEVVDNIVAEWA